ncbi:MAG TPA: translocation/assembly module TamB domain-containing protein, partial [Kofleriaceae bacterium]|nr:translocation/assembly module TamB domain-containing protein [Kofleriaceae bacterium]
MSGRHPGPRSARRRWAKRIVLGLAALIVFSLVGVAVLVHTSYGREELRTQIEQKLQNAFTGGATLGKLEGSPFGALTVHDVVINGPDGQPAIEIGTLRIEIELFDLLKHGVRLTAVIAEDVEVRVKRDADGTFELARLVKPRPEESPPGWNVELQAIELRRAHVVVDTGTRDAPIVNLDDLSIAGHAQLPARGERRAGLRLAATWRERSAPISIAAAFTAGPDTVAVPSLVVKLGDVELAATDVQVRPHPGAVPGFSGFLQVSAGKAAVARLMPRIALPADLALAIRAMPSDAAATPIAISGTLGPTAIRADLTADLAAKHVAGKLATGDFDLASLLDGKVVATGGGSIDFDVKAGAAGELPAGKFAVRGHGTFGDLPRAELAATIETGGQHVATTLDVTGAMRATITAELERTAGAITLTSATLHAATQDPARSSGGKVPVHGELAVALTAHGTLRPEPDLAVAGKITGGHLRMRDLSVGSLDVTVDGSRLPSQPRGKARVRLVDVQRGEVQFGALNVDAENRADGKFQVEVSSYPKQHPWLVELAALVTPPGRDQAIAIELGRHRIRAGNGTDWTGHTGHLVIGPTQIALRDFRTASRDGQLALAGALDRAGRHAGDLGARVDLERFALGALRQGYTGTVGAQVDVARRAGVWTGDVEIHGTGISDGNSPPNSAPGSTITARLQGTPSQVTIAATASNPVHGTAKLAVELAPPARLEDVAAWKQRGRAVIRTAQVTLQGIDLAQIALRAAPDLHVSGRLDGELVLTSRTTSGVIHVRNLASPELRGVRRVDADLALTETAAGELTPTLKIQAADIGDLVAQAQVQLPDRPLDPAAWRRLGLAAVRGASLETGAIAIDPAMLARFGVARSLRGRLRIGAQVAQALTSVAIKASMDDLRGSPIAQPVDVKLDAAIDRKAAIASVSMQSQGKPITLLQIHGRIPISPDWPDWVDRLRAGTLDVRRLPVTATVDLPKASAPLLLNALGRTEVTGGTLGGKVTIGGTVGAPTVVAHLAGEGLAVPPGPGGKPVKTIQQLAVDATWNQHGMKLALQALDGLGGTLAIAAEARPDALAEGTARMTATNFDLAPLLAFAPGPAGGGRGTLRANLSVTGFDPRTARILGDLRLEGARVPLAPTLGTLRDATIDLAIRPRDIAITTTGKLGAGDLTLDGTIARSGVALSGGQLALTLRKISPLGAVEPIIDADVTAKLARKGTQWTADVVVDNGLVKVTRSSGEKLKPIQIPADLTIGPAPPRARQPAGGAAPPPPPQPVIVANLVLHPINVESKEFRTTIRGSLAVKADARAIGVVGSIAAQGGDVDLFSRRYRVERAAVNFDGTIDPLLDVRITHDFPDVTTITEVGGRLSAPQLRLSSDPGIYSQSQLLGFLLGGEPGGDPTSGSARDKAVEAGASFIAGQIGGYIKKAL